jgi:putative glutamine amidotransferase
MNGSGARRDDSIQEPADTGRSSSWKLVAAPDGVASTPVARPVIGICAALERARYGAWNEPADLLPRDYVSAVEQAGAIAILLPVQASLIDDPDEALDRIDGLLLAGGADMDPSSYGAEAHPETVGWLPERDAMELALLRRALERELPVLGICRGMQLINVAFGGNLQQHIPDAVGSDSHRVVLGSFGEHEVRLEPGSLAAGAVSAVRHTVKSHHHQAVDAIGEGLTVTGWSTSDDLPEALEAPGHRYVLGVQWHPEADPASPVVASLVGAARKRTK